ncbi:MAG: hypothetical protein ABIK07_22465 [Planctomycetota bacterium]
MLLRYICKTKKTSKQKAKRKLSAELEKKRMELLFACFDIMLSDKRSDKPKDTDNGADALQYFSVDDPLIINYDKDRK